MNVTEALYARISIRAFTPEPVAQEEIESILDAARWAPSGGNMQPWKVIVVAGEQRQAVVDLAQRTLSADPTSEEGDRPMYPANLWEPYRSRRFELGEQMYALLTIPREDKAGRLARLAENMRFFGAPVGLFFVIDDRMGWGQWAHLGMFMHSVALVATEHGLGTCMQEYWMQVRRSLGEHFGLGEHELVYCGMALGHPDTTHPVNTLRSKRAEVGEIATFRGF